MPKTLQISRWNKTKVRKLFSSSNSYFRIVAHSPFTNKVKPLIDVYNLQDETILDMDEEQPMCVVEPTPLEVVVTVNQDTMTFNEDHTYIQTDVPESESDID